MPKPGDLAKRPDFNAGQLAISPSRRRVVGPAGEVTVEPLVMQVLLLLLDARGQVVSREELFERVWGGATVGDDSLNRAISSVRKIAVDVGPRSFEVETIPRTGYRLVGEAVVNLPGGSVSVEPAHSLSRRVVIGGGLTVAGIIAGGALGMRHFGGRPDRDFQTLLGNGVHALESADPAENPEVQFRQAVALKPGSAKAQGLLSYALAVKANSSEALASPALVLEAERAARASLQLDPSEPHAKLAEVAMQASMLDFAATEDRVRTVLAEDPDNIFAMRQLWTLLQCVGRSRDALHLIERALTVKPLLAGGQYPRAQLLWITGRTAEADRVIDKAMQYWPGHAYVRFARFLIFAYTGREDAALAMLERPETTPQNLSPPAVALWRLSLPAMADESSAAVAAARTANLNAAKANLRLTSVAAAALASLGDIDAAFEVTDALFAIHRPGTKGDVTGADKQRAAGSTAWRFAPWLFIPPLAPLRADPRFNAICDQIGLTGYWAKRGIRPDYLLDA